MQNIVYNGKDVLSCITCILVSFCLFKTKTQTMYDNIKYWGKKQIHDT